MQNKRQDPNVVTPLLAEPDTDDDDDSSNSHV